MKLLQPLLDRDCRFEAKFRSGLLDAGAGFGHISRLEGMRFDGVGLTTTGRNRLDQMIESDAVVIAEVENFITFAAIEGRENPCSDVIDVSEISFRGAIPVHRDRQPLFDQPGEQVDRHLGTLPRAIDGEESQACDVESVQVMEGVAQ